MGDPLSVISAVVGLVDVGVKVSKELHEKWKTFKGAEQDVFELAHEIDLCTSVLELFRQRIDPNNTYTYAPNLIPMTERFCEDMNRVLEDIRRLISGYEFTKLSQATYTFNASALKEHHSKLKGLQLSFLFLSSVLPPPQYSSPPATTANNSLGGLGSFEGTIQHIPIYSSDRGDPNGGSNQAVTYQATLTLRPSQSGQAAPGASFQPVAPKPQPDFTDQLEHIRKDKRLQEVLNNLRGSPFVSKDAFKGLFSRSRRPAKDQPFVGAPQPRMGAQPRMDTYPTSEAMRYTRKSKESSDSSEARKQRSEILEMRKRLGYLRSEVEKRERQLYARMDELEQPYRPGEVDERYRKVKEVEELKSVVRKLWADITKTEDDLRKCSQDVQPLPSSQRPAAAQPYMEEIPMRYSHEEAENEDLLSYLIDDDGSSERTKSSQQTYADEDFVVEPYPAADSRQGTTATYRVVEPDPDYGRKSSPYDRKSSPYARPPSAPPSPFDLSYGGRSPAPVPPPVAASAPPKVWTCDGCNEQMIYGRRWRCNKCEDFDFCGDCFTDPRKMERHPHSEYQFDVVER